MKNIKKSDFLIFLFSTSKGKVGKSEQIIRQELVVRGTHL